MMWQTILKADVGDSVCCCHSLELVRGWDLLAMIFGHVISLMSRLFHAFPFRHSSLENMTPHTGVKGPRFHFLRNDYFSRAVVKLIDSAVIANFVWSTIVDS